MYALLFSLAIFFFWGLIGVSTLTVFPSELGPRQKLLISPAVGIALNILIVFLLNRTGLPVKYFSTALSLGLLIVSSIIIMIKRPRFFEDFSVFILILVGALILVAWPMLNYGFDWTSYNNDDMANYCLGAQRFLNHGYFELPNLKNLFSGRDYSEAYWFMHAAGGMRSGSELMLAFFWGATKLNAHQLFMPVILALHLSLISAIGALLASDGYSKRASLIAMLLFSIAPLGALGVLYQLIGQVGGLTLLCAAVVLFFRVLNCKFEKKLILNHVVATLIFCSLFIWYPEALPFLGLGWFIFLGLQLRKSIHLGKKIIIPAIVIGILTLCFIGHYSISALNIMLHQTSGGMSYTNPDSILFPYFLVPSGLPTFFGLLPLVTGCKSIIMDGMIIFALCLLAWLLVKVVQQIKEINPVAIMCALMMVLGLVLFFRNSDFGLFKLAMIIQPFMIAVVATEFSKRKFANHKKSWCLLLFVVSTALISQHQYVLWSLSRYAGGPNNLPFASVKKINHHFQLLMNSLLNNKNKHYLVDTSNVTQAKYQALYSQGLFLHFPSRDFFKSIIAFDDFESISPYVWKQSNGNSIEFIEEFKYLWRKQYKKEYLMLKNIKNSWVKLPEEEVKDSQFIAVPEQGTIFNLFNKKQISQNFFKNYLIFVNSTLGSHFYYAPVRSKIAFFHLQEDPMFPGRFFSGLGQHLLFRIIDSDEHPRMVLELSNTLLKESGSLLPHKLTIFGDVETMLPFVGRGSGRLISDPLTPAKLTNNRRFIHLDIGQKGQLHGFVQPKLMSLYGRYIKSDSRLLTTYGRNISLISDEDYKLLVPPSQLEHFPQDLGNNNLQYSGLYEDGWVSEHALFVLQPQVNSKALKISGMIPKLSDPNFTSELKILIDGKVVETHMLNLGNFDLNIPILTREKPQRIELIFSRSQRLPGSDARIVSSKINFIGYIG